MVRSWAHNRPRSIAQISFLCPSSRGEAWQCRSQSIPGLSGPTSVCDSHQGDRRRLSRVSANCVAFLSDSHRPTSLPPSLSWLQDDTSHQGLAGQLDKFPSPLQLRTLPHHGGLGEELVPILATTSCEGHHRGWVYHCSCGREHHKVFDINNLFTR